MTIYLFIPCEISEIYNNRSSHKEKALYVQKNPVIKCACRMSMLVAQGKVTKSAKQFDFLSQGPSNRCYQGSVPQLPIPVIVSLSEKYNACIPQNVVSLNRPLCFLFCVNCKELVPH